MDGKMIAIVVVLAVLFLALIIVPMFTNKKKQKSVNEMHTNLKKGDKIMTIGGIIGYIVEVKEINALEKVLLIESGEGDNKTNFSLDIKGLYQVLSRENGGEPQIEAAATVFDAVQDNEMISSEEVIVAVTEAEDVSIVEEATQKEDKPISSKKATPKITSTAAKKPPSKK